MNKQTLTNKERVFGLYSLALIRIKECEKVKGEIIRFPILFEKLCRSFSIKKKEAWELLFILSDFGFIEIVRFHGIKILRSKE
ncbi:hypothetical protein J4407_02585 [Candidatus Pacearchaeota archaeon]|nr:hypothetical protein [Candidatus Pacearchaeota archaeon]